MNRVESAACDAVIAVEHPSPEDGGPCWGCAFRKGTEANRDDVTQMMIRLCVEGYRQFDCHMQPGMCKGWIAAMNLRGEPKSEKDRKKADVVGTCADLAAAIIGQHAKQVGR